jgi:hypothetical protein
VVVDAGYVAQFSIWEIYSFEQVGSVAVLLSINISFNVFDHLTIRKISEAQQPGHEKNAQGDKRLAKGKRKSLVNCQPIPKNGMMPERLMPRHIAAN